MDQQSSFDKIQGSVGWKERLDLPVDTDIVIVPSGVLLISL